MIDELVKIGFNINAKNKDGNTPIHLAAANDHLEVFQSLSKNPKADLSVVNKEGYTPRQLIVKHYLFPPFNKMLQYARSLLRLLKR